MCNEKEQKGMGCEFKSEPCTKGKQEFLELPSKVWYYDIGRGPTKCHTIRVYMDDVEPFVELENGLETFSVPTINVAPTKEECLTLQDRFQKDILKNNAIDVTNATEKLNSLLAHVKGLVEKHNNLVVEAKGAGVVLEPIFPDKLFTFKQDFKGFYIALDLSMFKNGLSEQSTQIIDPNPPKRDYAAEYEYRLLEAYDVAKGAFDAKTMLEIANKLWKADL